MPPSRKDLAAWATRLSGEPVTAQLKELSTGVIFCRLLESGRPGSVETRKLMTSTRSEADAVTNLKLFMAGLEKSDPTGELAGSVEVENLAKGQPQATLRMLQHMYSFVGGDAESAAARGAGGALAPVDGNTRSSRRTARKPPAKGGKGKAAQAEEEEEEAPPPTPGTTNAMAAVAALTASLDPALAAQQSVAARHQGVVQDLQEERDFYLTKLRLVESAAEDAADAEEGDRALAERVLKILRCHEDAVCLLAAV